MALLTEKKAQDAYIDVFVNLTIKKENNLGYILACLALNFDVLIILKDEQD